MTETLRKEHRMRNTVLLALLAALALAADPIGRAQTPAQPSPGQTAPAVRGRGAPPTPVFTLEDNFLQWRLLPGEKAYEAIDGSHLLQYVRDLGAISRRYRDNGHPQFWGRII